MSIPGQATEVRVESRGSQLVGDHASGATAVTVQDPAPFDGDGGQVSIDGAIYAYTALAEVADAADPGGTNGVLTLTSGLTAAVADTTPVHLWSGAQILNDVILTVDVGVESGPVDVRLPSGKRKDWSALEGRLDPPVAVNLANDYSDVLDAPGYTPSVDLTTALNLPDPSVVATVAPTSSPTITVTGMATGLMVTTQGIAPSSVLDYLIDGVVVRSGTRSTAEYLTTTGAGLPLATDTDYSVTVVARNAAGSAAPSAAVVARLDLGVDPEFVRAVIRAGLVFGGAAQFGNITIDPTTGITIPLSNGGVIQFPADGTDAVITAILRARSLVVENNLRILGNLNAVVGGLQLANGTGAPTIKPRAGTTWSDAVTYLQTTTDPNFGIKRGLYSDTSTWVATTSLYATQLTFIDKTTGGFLNSEVPGMTWAYGGVTKVGTNWYVLGRDSSRADAWYVYILNSSLAKTGEWLVGAYADFARNPCIASDGTSIFIAYQPAATSQLRVRTYTTAGVAGSFYILDNTWNAHVTGLYVGTADFGASRVVAAYSAGVRVYTNTGASGTTQTRQTANTWTPANGEELRGLAWDGTRFHSLGSSGKVWHYSLVAADTARSITHTWYDDDAAGTGTHETTASPALSYTQKARQWLRVETDPPSFAGFPDDPNAVRIYIANQLQATLATGVTAAVYDIPTTGGLAAPTSNGFSGVSAPGSLTSGASDGAGAILSFLGSADARVGWLRTDPTGKGKDNVGLRSAPSPATSQSIPDTTPTMVTLGGTVDHDGGAFSVASSVATINFDGLYAISASIRWDAVTTAGRRILRVESFTGSTAVGSGTTVAYGEVGAAATGVQPTSSVATDVWLAAGSKLRLIVVQTTGAALAVRSEVVPLSQLNVRRVG